MEVKEGKETHKDHKHVINESVDKISVLRDKLQQNYYDKSLKIEMVNTIYKNGFHDDDVVKKPQYIILPQSPVKFYFDLLNYICALYSLWFLPIDMGFSKECLFNDEVNQVLFIIDIIVAIVFTSSILLKFFVAYYNKKGLLEFDFKKISIDYIRTEFVFDVVSAIPWGLIGATFKCDQPTEFIHNIHYFFALSRFFKVTKLNKYIDKINSEYINIFRLFNLLLFFFYTCHFLGTFVTGVTTLRSVYRERFEQKDVDFLYLYSNCLYYGINLILGTELGAIRPNDRVLITVVEIISLAITANLFGYIAIILEKIDSSDIKNSINLRNKLDLLNEYLLYEKINENLRTEVNDFYKFMFIRQRILFEKDLYKDLNEGLSNSLKFELWKTSYFVKDSLFSREEITSPFFSRCISTMNGRIYMKNDIITEEGENSFDLFMLCMNSCAEVYCEGLLMNVMKEGEYFGETAVFTSSKKRTATVMSKTNGDFLVIPGKCFYKAILDFESERDFFAGIAGEYLNSYYNIASPNKYNLFISRKDKVYKTVIHENLYINPEVQKNALFYRKNLSENKDIFKKRKYDQSMYEPLEAFEDDELDD